MASPSAAFNNNPRHYITSTINTGTLTALVTGLDVTTISDVDYYKFTSPSNSTSTLLHGSRTTAHLPIGMSKASTAT